MTQDPPFPVIPTATALSMGTPQGDPTDTTIGPKLAKINQEIYERNSELALRNRTLSIISKVYQIINTSLGVRETAQGLIDAVVSELGFLKGFVMTLNEAKTHLKMTAVSKNRGEEKAHMGADAIFKNLEIAMVESENLCVRSVAQKKRRLTNNLHDVFAPKIDLPTAVRLQSTLGVATLIVDPIVFAGEALGVMVLGIGKHIGYVSKAEFEALRGIGDVVAIAVERAQIYKHLVEANEKLKELDHLKDEFVSVASHELRTPMTSIKSYLWLALEGRGGPIPEKQRLYLERAYDSTSRLINLVNDMLNISRIESGRVSIELRRVDIQRLVREVMAEVMPRADELGLHIAIKRPAGMLEVVADPDKIKEVLTNLIGNSLKFTPKGGTITLSFTLKDTTVVTSVTDTGIGIPPEEMSRLFQKFGMIKSSYVVYEQASTGTGLGLYICKSIIELHGGQIWADSRGQDQGTTFSFSLPQYSEAVFKKMEEKFKGKGEVGLMHTSV